MDERDKARELASVRSFLERLVDRRLLQGFTERDAEEYAWLSAREAQLLVELGLRSAQAVA